MVIRDTSLLAKIVVCGAAWVLPIITSFTALGLNLYHPVSGNWCWIQAKPIYLRYLLTHMWRFLFIILSTAIYIYIYIWVNRHFKAMRLLGSPNDGSDATDAELGRKHRPVNLVPEDGTKSATLVASTNHHPKPSPSSRDGVVINQSFTLNESYVKERSPNPAPPVPITGATDTETYIKRTLLLNAYPIMYILLWIPGIANRLAEASGHPSRALAIMQASTQYIGLANAVTYGLNERVLGQLKTLFLGD
ncbi:MAG: hypothetical protein M1833_000037 [Piccolia ochrophora]|nr:MAG: hypothetical protein M1833_000037 [Piccolia ochrophora]